MTNLETRRMGRLIGTVFVVTGVALLMGWEAAIVAFGSMVFIANLAKEPK